MVRTSEPIPHQCGASLGHTFGSCRISTAGIRSAKCIRRKPNLAGGNRLNEGDMDSVIYLFSKLVAVRGTVLPIVDTNLHLAASYKTAV